MELCALPGAEISFGREGRIRQPPCPALFWILWRRWGRRPHTHHNMEVRRSEEVGRAFLGCNVWLEGWYIVWKKHSRLEMTA